MHSLGYASGRLLHGARRLFFALTLTRILVMTTFLVMTISPLRKFTEAIQRECRNLRRAREIAREYRKSAVRSLHRNDPVWASNNRHQAQHAWGYVARHREEIERQRRMRTECREQLRLERMARGRAKASRGAA